MVSWDCGELGLWGARWVLDHEVILIRAEPERSEY